MRSILLAAAIVLSGCSGLQPCGGADFGAGNNESAGTYTGTYTNTVALGSTGTAKGLTLALTVTAEGTVTGTVTEPSSGRITTVTGNLVDSFHACDQDTTTFQLDFVFDGEPTRLLRATKKRHAFTTFSATADYLEQTETAGYAGIGRGKLAVTRS